MLTRKILELKCYSCNEALSDFEITCQEFDGMCENCYGISMSTAYDDDWLDGIDNFGDED